jgi:hypothetical protein
MYRDRLRDISAERDCGNGKSVVRNPDMYVFTSRSLTCAVKWQGVCEATLHVGFQVYMAGSVKALFF